MHAMIHVYTAPLPGAQNHNQIRVILFVIGNVCVDYDIFRRVALSPLFLKVMFLSEV